MSKLSGSPFVVKFLFVIYILGIIFRLNIFFPSEEGFTGESYWRLGEMVLYAGILFSMVQRHPFTWKLGMVDAVLTLRGAVNVILLLGPTKQLMIDAINEKGAELDEATIALTANLTLYGTLAIIVISASVYAYLWLRAKPFFENPNWTPPKKAFDNPSDV